MNVRSVSLKWQMWSLNCNLNSTDLILGRVQKICQNDSRAKGLRLCGSIREAAIILLEEGETSKGRATAEKCY